MKSLNSRENPPPINKVETKFFVEVMYPYELIGERNNSYSTPPNIVFEYLKWAKPPNPLIVKEKFCPSKFDDQLFKIDNWKMGNW